MISERPTHRESGFLWDLLHIVQGYLAVGLLADLLVHTINEVSVALSGGATPLPFIGFAGLDFRWGICNLFASAPACDVIRLCVFAGLITYVVFKLVCQLEWVQEEVSWEECWEEIKLYNPWSWVKTLVCVTKTALQWVLKQICRWIGYIVVVAIIICIIAGLVAIA